MTRDSSIEPKWILFLKRKRTINLVLLIGYYLLVVLPHEWIGLLTVDLFGHLERDVYNSYVLIAGLAGCFLIIGLFIPTILRAQEILKILVYLLLSIGLAAVTINWLFVINIEIVHFFQYAGFAILCFPLVQNFTRTLIWTTLAGAVDEAWQYFYLAPERTLYYDFNDVIANLVGGTFGVLILKSIGASIVPMQRPLIKTLEFKVIMTLTIIFYFLWLQNIIGIYPESNATYTLIRERAEGFWSVVHPNVTYHVVQPLEGVLICIAIILIYLPLTKRS